jgi:hypothetical protein
MSSSSAAAPFPVGVLDDLVKRLADVRLTAYRRYRTSAQRMQIIASTLRKSGADGDALFDLLSDLGEHLGKRFDELHLKDGTHAELTKKLETLNKAISSWLVGFERILQGKPIRRGEAIEIQRLLAAAFLESHHVVEKRLLTLYPAGEVAQTLVKWFKNGDGMIAVALTSASHRGSAYVSLGGQALDVKKALKKRPAGAENLTTELQKHFKLDYFEKNPSMSEFLRDLDKKYLEFATDIPKTPDTPAKPGIITMEMYAGLRKGLVRIAKETGTPWQ